MTADYANLFETEFRPRRALAAKTRRLLARTVWAGLFLVRPRLALAILRERANTSGMKILRPLAVFLAGAMLMGAAPKDDPHAWTEEIEGEQALD